MTLSVTAENQYVLLDDVGERETRTAMFDGPGTLTISAAIAVRARLVINGEPRLVLFLEGGKAHPITVGPGRLVAEITNWAVAGASDIHVTYRIAADAPIDEQAMASIRQLTRIADAFERMNALATGAPRW